MEKLDRYLQEDLKTLKKINTIPDFYNKLELAFKYVKDLNINSELQFYLYMQTKLMKSKIEGIKYEDIQSYIRFQNKEYYEYVQEQSKINKKDNVIVLKPKKIT